MAAKPPVGFIGMGHMGLRMSRRLLDAGFPLVVHNRTRERAEPLITAGARWADTPRALAAGCEFVITSLTDDAAVEEVAFGPDGTFAGAKPGAILIEMSTITPHTQVLLNKAAVAQGLRAVDAPVSGSTPQAEKGELLIFVGGEQSTYERCRPLFEAMGKQSFHVGPAGSGAMMKIVVNALLGAGMQILAEALALGRKSGLDYGTLIDVLSQTAVLSPTQKGKLANARANTYPTAFPLRLMKKDFGLVFRRAEELSVPMPATAAAEQVYVAEHAKGIEEDMSAVIRLMQELAGIKA